MSLTSSLYSGISGMTNLGNAMQIIGDNIANVNTTAFKGSRYIFQDLLSQSIATQAGTAQVGRGMALGDVSAVFQQGSFETTGNTTDLAIGGDGFFVLRESGTEQLFYSRAGNFSFDKDGVLINSEGYVVQGWALDEEGDDIGSVTDIMLISFTSPPDVSEHLTVITNLDSDAESQTAVLSNAWDATEDSPIDDSNYNYQTVIKVYDSLGSTHDITVYYDKKSGSEWEYMICCNPEEDNRNLVQGTEGKGILARGVITFSESSGTISDITMSRLTGLVGNVSASGAISEETTNFTIENYDAITLDGYGFSLEFDGSSWTFEDVEAPTGVITSADLPDNYPYATILSGDANGIRINLDGDAERTADLVITFSTPAQATDSLTFDLINPTNNHIQDVTNTTYVGDTGNDNTTLEINNPEVLTQDSSGLRINWDASEETWYWSMPTLQNIMNMDTSNLVPAGTTATETVVNAEVMSSYSENVTVQWDSTDSTWHFVSPYARELTNMNYGGGINESNTTTTITDPTELTERALDNALYWDNIVGVTGLTYGNENGTNRMIAATTTMTQVQQENFTRDGSYTLEFYDDSAGGSFQWVGNDPTAEYPNLQALTWDATTQTLSIDLTGDGDDITFEFTSGTDLDATNFGETISFSIDADGAWSWAMTSISNPTYGGGITGSNTTMEIPTSLTNGPGESYNGYYIDSTVPYNLVYTSATDTWTWGANDPTVDGYLSSTITGDANEVSIDLDSDGAADITYTFTTPLTADGTLDFEIDANGGPPVQYSSASILSTSNSDAVSVDLTGNGTADLTFSFLSSLTADGYITFDIDTYVPPFEYADAVIDTTSSGMSGLYIDLDGDSVNDVSFAFDNALTDNGYFQFDIDPRVPPEEYPYATISGDEDEVTLDMNNDNEDDITFSFETPLPTGVGAQDSAINFDIEGTTAWTEVETNSNGYLEFMADFLGGENGGTEMLVEFDIGTRDDGTGNFVNESMTTTQYAKASTTTFQAADGYGAGDLEGVDVDVDGVMTGIYSNGQLIPLYRVALAKFLNVQGLYKEGGSLYRETRDSGTAITNKPGTNGLGSITPNSLEQSNVDIAEEFVKMITTQRGFQANSKIVTTVDTMLGETINMKR